MPRPPSPHAWQHPVAVERKRERSARAESRGHHERAHRAIQNLLELILADDFAAGCEVDLEALAQRLQALRATRLSLVGAFELFLRGLKRSRAAEALCWSSPMTRASSLRLLVARLMMRPSMLFTVSNRKMRTCEGRGKGGGKAAERGELNGQLDGKG